MSNDDDTLADFDLTAWEAPPPPAGLADAVLERMGGTQVNVAVPVEAASPPRRRWLALGMTAAVIAVVAGVGAAVWSLTGDPQRTTPATGEIIAERAQVLTLDTVRATLDPGAEVRWRREAGRLHVEQRAGTVAWHVDGNEKLVIAAGAGLAAVEATGANLRVEVKMNATDARVIKASAVTAAAVAMVTVIVYEGHVKAGRGEATVVVAPGSTYQIENEDTRPVVGGSEVTVAREEGSADVEEQEAADRAKQDELDEQPKREPRKVKVASGLDRAAIQRAMNALRSKLSACDDKGGGKVVAKMRVAPSGKVASVEATSDNAALAACVEPIVETARFVATERGGTFNYPLVFSAPDHCDAQALKEQGMEHINLGEHAAALAKFEASLKCKRDVYVFQLAFMSACASYNSAKAKRYYKELPPTVRDKVAQICVRQKVEYQ